MRIAAEFAKRQLNAQTIWISNPTWPNHNAIAKAVGIQDKPYRYYDAAKHGLDWDGMIEDLSQAQKGDIVLLHGCCHNPTGIDPTPEQWETLAKLSAEKGWLPLFDFAYQGFGNGLEEDAYGLRVFLKYNKELLIASSYSKNFGMANSFFKRSTCSGVKPLKENIPFCSIMKSKSWLAPLALSNSTNFWRMALMRPRISSSSAIHCAFKSSFFNTSAMVFAPCEAGLEYKVRMMVLTWLSARSLWWPKTKQQQPAPTAKSKPSSVPCIPTRLHMVRTPLRWC